MIYSKKYAKMVYQGGHHEVYCDGKDHLTLSGDGFGKSPLSKDRKSARIETSECNCSHYR